jgi:hypothetical protein
VIVFIVMRLKIDAEHLRDFSVCEVFSYKANYGATYAKTHKPSCVNSQSQVFAYLLFDGVSS